VFATQVGAICEAVKIEEMPEPHREMIAAGLIKASVTLACTRAMRKRRRGLKPSPLDPDIHMEDAIFG
jgi:hypothetical protein